MSDSMRLYFGAAMALALSACIPVPNAGMRLAMRSADTIEAAQTLAARGNTAWPPDQWWRLAGDPQLTALIEEGLANSPQVSVAMARIRRAEAEAQRVGAARMPTIGADAEGGLRRQSGNNGIPAQFLPDGWKDYGQTSLSFGFDLDLWGRNRAAYAAATSEARAAMADAAQARLVLSVAITAAYAELGRHYRERDNAAATLANRRSMRDLVAQRQRNGLDNLASLRRADAEVALAEQDLAAVDENIGIRRNQLAALLGAGPDRGTSITRPPRAPSTPGGVPAGVTTDAEADELVGYGLYIDLLGPLAHGKPRQDFPLGGEEARCRYALEEAGKGRNVALICSGDAGIYAMGALVFELLHRGPDEMGVSDAARRVDVVSAPGVSALQAAAARAGAPLGHDFCAISLSDLLTPREDILRRLKAAAEGDFVIAFYNPVSKRRRTLLAQARDILLAHRPADTPVLLASSLGRPEEELRYRRLDALQVDEVDMLTVVLVGSSQTRLAQLGTGPRMFTPRGYARRIDGDLSA